MLRDALTLLGEVAVVRKVASNDGKGGVATTSSTAVLARAAIWQAASASMLVAARVAMDSTHVLVHESDEHTWAAGDREVTFRGETFKVNGRPEDVMNLGEITVVGLKAVAW